MQRFAWVLGVFFVWSFSAYAGTYSFGGGCAWMGAWSQAALNQAETIMHVVESLKDNPNCKGLETIVPKLQIAQDVLKTPEGETKRTDRLESIPNELAALRNFAVASPELKAQVYKLLTFKTFEGASLAAEASTAAGGAAAAAAGPAAAIAMAVKDLGVRVLPR